MKDLFHICFEPEAHGSDLTFKVDNLFQRHSILIGFYVLEVYNNLGTTVEEHCNPHNDTTPSVFFDSKNSILWGFYWYTVQPTSVSTKASAWCEIGTLWAALIHFKSHVTALDFCLKRDMNQIFQMRYYTGGQVSWYSKFSGKHYCYFNHLSKRVQKQMILHLKALI